MSEETKGHSEESLRDQIEREARLFAEQEETITPKPAVVTPAKEEPSIDASEQQAEITSLGKAEKFKVYENQDDPLAAEMGWKTVPIEYLPSQGLFYEPGTQVAIRAATVAEIRHWSTIDENDLLGVDDMLNFIIEKCVKIKVPNKMGNFKDLKEIDRFYLIFAVRDYTFKNGENKLFVNVTLDNGNEDRVEVTKDIIDYFNPDERLMNYYDRDNCCFTINMKNGESFKIYYPSLGTMAFIKNYLRSKQQASANYDKAFIKYAPFLFSEWRTISVQQYDKAVQDSYSWSFQKISVLDKIVEMLSQSINPQIRYSTGGGEATAPLNFPGGIKSLFLISDIFGELV